MRDEPDADLRERFAALRREEEVQAAALALPGARIRHPGRFKGWAASTDRVSETRGTT